MDVSECIWKVYVVCVALGISALFIYSAHGDGMNVSTTADDSGDTNFDNLYPAIVQCFTIVISGYAAGRLNLLNRQEAKGVNTFVSNFSLPCMIFLSLAELNFTSVNWSLLASILLAKSIVFFGVILVTICVSRPVNYAKPGLYAIFCTQSNDFAIGYPLLVALYGKTHPDYPSYLYLMAPISLVILNPIAFVLMEIERLKRPPQKREISRASFSSSPEDEEEEVEPSSDGAGASTTSHLRLFCTVLKSIGTNPIVFMTVLGIIGNFFYAKIIFLAGILRVFSSAFSATSLFVLGLRMVGSVHKLKGNNLLIPGVLIAVKLLVFPLVAREVISLTNPGSNATESLDLSTFGFLYGTFPTAPAVFVFATQYNLDVDLISSSMVACTFLSAPLIFVSAKMTSLDASRPEKHYEDLLNFSYDLGWAGIIVGAWLILLFTLSRKIHSLPHKTTAFLIASQVIICLGAVVQPAIANRHSMTFYIQFSILAFGVFGSRIWSALLSVTLLFMEMKSLCFVLNLLPYFILLGWGLPVILVAIIGLLGYQNSLLGLGWNPFFIYGKVQSIVTLIVLLPTLIVTSGCLVFHQRYRRRNAKYRSLVRDVNGGSPATAPPARAVTDIEELAAATTHSINTADASNCNGGDWCASNQCSESARATCSATLREYRDALAALPDDVDDPGEPQITRHVVLLLTNIISMFVASMLAAWTLVTSDLFSGIYVELSFLDVTLTVGQIFVSFVVFGLDAWSIVSPLVNRWRKLWYGAETIPLIAIDELSFETTHVCHQFIAHHLAQCEREIARNVRFRLVIYKCSFKGSDLVEWLLSRRLTKDRADAKIYADHLLDGRVIRHVENRHHFSDSNLLFTFKP